MWKRGTFKSQFLRLSLARFFRDGKHAILWENLVIESLKYRDVRQVLCILTIFCRFKPKNVCILPKFSSFQLFQSGILLVKCCREVIVRLEVVYFFEFSVFKQEYFLCKFEYIIMMTACAAAYRATVLTMQDAINLPLENVLNDKNEFDEPIAVDFCHLKRFPVAGWLHPE